MVGGFGNRRDEGSLVINNTNVFSALETLRKKKKSDKDKLLKSKSSESSSSSAARGKGSDPPKQLPQVFWAPAPLKAKSWADVDDDEDDDYYATTAPPPSVWGKTAQAEGHNHEINDNTVEDTESDEDILDEGDEELEDEHENELDVVQPEPTVKKSTESADVSATTKEIDRQLSKKERKKKELAELEALLADFGVSPKESNGQDESGKVLQDKKDGELLDGEGEKKDNAPAESKAAKKKKKKEKSSKDAKDAQYQPNNSDTRNGVEDNAGTEQTGEDGSSVDMKERLKKMASTKKKKSGKEVDAGAKAAAQEAAARSAKLAAAKKKEKNHYNQQPVR